MTLALINQSGELEGESSKEFSDAKKLLERGMMGEWPDPTLEVFARTITALLMRQKPLWNI